MNRQIEFRVWYQPTQRFIYHCSVGNGIVQHDEQNFTFLDEKDCVVQQFIGLKDKNDKKIFEGDLVKTGWNTNPNDMDLICKVVYWMNGFYLEYNNHFIGDTIYQFEACEIIGNVFENPELCAN